MSAPKGKMGAGKKQGLGVALPGLAVSKKKPSGKFCTCPICGNMHKPGEPHGHDGKTATKLNKQPKNLKPMTKAENNPPSPPPSEQPNGDKGGKKITQDGVENALGKIHEGVVKTINDKKFKNSFMLNYDPLQKGLLKQSG